MAPMRVVEWRSAHQFGLERVLGLPDALCATARSLFGPPVDGPQWRFTLVAERAGAPIGVVVVWASRWHPQRLWISVEVAAAYRRKGIGTALVEAARARCCSDGRPLRAKVLARSAAAAFASAQGFKLIQCSRTFRLEAAPCNASGDHLVDMPAPPRSAAGAFREFYLSSHGWDPPGLISIDDILTTHVNEAATTIVVCSPVGEPLAVGCLYEDDGELTLSGGPTDPTDPRADSAIATLLDAAPRPLLVEVDDSVPALRRAVDHRRAVLVDEVHIVAEA